MGLVKNIKDVEIPEEKSYWENQDTYAYPHSGNKTLIDEIYETEFVSIVDKSSKSLKFGEIYQNFLGKEKIEISQDKKVIEEIMNVDDYNDVKAFLEKRDKIKLLVDEWKKDGDKYIHSYDILGEYIKEKRKVVLYINNIKKYCDVGTPNYEYLTISTFIHELFHAYFHYVTEQLKSKKDCNNYIFEIEEAMSEFCTLVLLKTMAKNDEKWQGVLKKAKDNISSKQKHVGNLAAYGFGAYLFKNINCDDCFKWINQYIKRLGNIDENNETVIEYVKKVRITNLFYEDCKDLLQKILFENNSKSTNYSQKATQINFTEQIVSDIKLYLEELGKSSVILYNELHLQMKLSQFLVKKGYDIFYEYYVPTNLLKGDYPWFTQNGDRQEMYLDLVVYDEKLKEYVPIEIKYKTCKLNKDADIFGKVEKGVDVLRTQSAQDLGMYGFWKDVYRLELVRDTYTTVNNGIAIFVTNDQAYSNHSGIKSKNTDKYNYYDFRMTDGRQNVNGCLKWRDKNSKIAKKHPCFSLTGTYNVNWNPIGKHSSPRSLADFSYCLVII